MQTMVKYMKVKILMSPFFSSVTVSIVYLSASEFASTRSFFNTKTRDIEKTTSIVEMPIFSIPDD